MNTPFQTSQVIPIIVLLLFATGIGACYYIIGQTVGGNDNSSNINASLKTILGINCAMFVIFGLFNYLLFNRYTGFVPTYNALLLHLSFFLSFMAMSITLLDKTSS